jgi:hypothetical protein
MEYTNESLGVAFELPDKITVRQQLRFRSAIAFANGPAMYERFWAGAVELVTEWKSEDWPDIKAIDLDAADDVRLADLVQYVGDVTGAHMVELRSAPKN